MSARRADARTGRILQPFLLHSAFSNLLPLIFNSAISAQKWQFRPRRASSRLAHDLPPDQPAADFARAGTDLVEFCVAQQAAGRVVVDIAVAAEELDGVERALGGLFGRIEDAAGG